MTLATGLFLTVGSPAVGSLFAYGDLEDDFDVPDETPLEEVPDWSQPGGGDGQPGDIVVRGKELAQERQIANGSAYRKGGPNGPKRRIVKAKLKEVGQDQGHIAPILQDGDNFVGVTYDAGQQAVAIDHRSNGITNRVLEESLEVTSDSTIGAVVSGGKVRAVVNGKQVGAEYTVADSITGKGAGLVAKGLQTASWISLFSFTEIKNGYGHAYGVGYGQ